MLARVLSTNHRVRSIESQVVSDSKLIIALSRIISLRVDADDKNVIGLTFATEWVAMLARVLSTNHRVRSIESQVVSDSKLIIALSRIIK